MGYTVVFILTALVLSSCSYNNEAMELSRNFFTSLSDTTYGKPGDFYPLYDSLHIVAKSDAVDIEESGITVKNDTIAVRCYNNYTDATGTIKQDSITLFIAKDKESSCISMTQRG